FMILGGAGFWQSRIHFRIKKSLDKANHFPYNHSQRAPFRLRGSKCALFHGVLFSRTPGQSIHPAPS
ncbi:MAG: hypothetical protein OD918_03175, partial [Gammaproteobacteria bacterium]